MKSTLKQLLTDIEKKEKRAEKEAFVYPNFTILIS